ncbi:murein biosynthesis integral membrane protein MurJ [Halobacillus halophilus]|uniref:Lipid II flippase n=1 Tax=Halobacillus halophilus (strain ATCC 35676 / DSM 2266 / JCM 20832 / KCTC 3685 / LMG 17431 / NBRC 102448 / NCIMB 2269) TaxID=866895 RepID=I0JRP0_HALH3|nr:murein biosynthesis integral membrane protein MurJ [Halobacillus halophilus]ASF40775.1 murein biosynthesis integral membrane protein MurJ [Halobacillus halophilus]CCG46811.1 integral membrane protein MviN [Halobacillus halophilus DSM 2266]
MKSKLGLASILFIGATLLLKVSGLIRDMVIAYYFGDSYVADAYLAAFIIPNMLILFMTNGMKNALVPTYIQSLEKNRGKTYLGQVFKGTLVLAFILSIIGMAIAPFLIPLLYPEFSPEATQIATWVTIIFFSCIAFVGMNAVLEAFFDAENKFSLSIVSQIIVILSSILAAFLFANQIGAYSLALGYLAGTILSLIFKLFLVVPRKVMDVKQKIEWPEVKQFYWIFLPVGLTVAVGQVNLMVGAIFASGQGEGAVTYINYAKNLVHMPQAIFGVTIATIIFPMLSKAITKDDTPQFKKGIEKGLTTMYLVLLPSVIGMMLLMPNLIELLYERGAFNNEATQATTNVAYLYFGSVIFFSLNNVINKGFYTMNKGHLILFISIGSILINVLFNFLFASWLGYLGIPLAASLMALFYTGACLIIFVRLVGGIDFKYLAVDYGKITFAVIIMSGAVIGIQQLIGGLPNLVQIIIVAIVGAVVFAASSFVMKINAFLFLLNNIRKRGKNSEA